MLRFIYFLKHTSACYLTAAKTIFCPECGNNVRGDDYCVECEIGIPKRWVVHPPRSAIS